MERDLAALLAFLGERAAMPHAIGRWANDCISFAFEAARVQTGHDALGGLRWSTLRGGLRVIAREGGVEAGFDARFRRIAPAMAKRGDIAGVADEALGLHPMIVEGETLVGPGEKGQLRLPRRLMLAAWSVTEPLR
jgi:hypothetical protein